MLRLAAMTRVARLYKWRRCYCIHQITILVALVRILVNLAAVGAVLTDECSALLDFKSSITDERGIFGTWKAEEVPCEWYGISCDKHYHVTGINLPKSDLSGTISPELQRLRKLQVLNLSDNNFTGPVPSQISKIGK